MKEKAYINAFVNPIFKKTSKHDFNAWLELRKVLKNIKKISPNFDTLYQIWDMLKTVNECYMHSYTEDSELHLFLASLPKNSDANNTYAMAYKEKDFSIKFVLQIKSNSKIINMEINRSSINSAQPERISFEDGTYVLKNDIEIEKFLFITSCLMNGTAEVIKYYYKNKRF